MNADRPKQSSKELWEQARNAPGTREADIARAELKRRWTASQRPVATLSMPVKLTDINPKCFNPQQRKL
jgi:hypothetical protein